MSSRKIERILVGSLFVLAMVCGTARSAEPLSPEHRELVRERDRLGKEAGQLRLKGDFAGAIERVRRMLDIERTVSGPQHPEVAVLLEYLADLQFDHADFTAGVNSKRDAIAIWRAADGPDHWRTRAATVKLQKLEKIAAMTPEQRAEIRRAEHELLLASQLTSLGLWEAAEPRLTHGLEVYQRLFGDDSLDTGMTWFQLGRYWQARGNTQRAVEALEKALRMIERRVGTGHPDTAEIQHQMGKMLMQQGRYEHGLKLLTTAWDYRRQAMRPKNPIYRETINDLIQARLDWGDKEAEAGRFESFLTSREGVCDLVEQTFGINDQRMTQFVTLRREARILAKSVPADQQRWRSAQDRLPAARAARQKNDSRKSLDLVEAAERDFELVLGFASTAVGDCLAFKVELAHDSGDPASAVELSEVVIQHHRQLLGDGHPETNAAQVRRAEILHDWSVDLHSDDGCPAARAKLTQAIELLSAVAGHHPWKFTDWRRDLRTGDLESGMTPADRDNLDTIRQRLNAAEQFRRKRDFANCRVALEECLRNVRKLSLPGHRLEYRCLANLGSLAKMDGRFHDSVPPLEEALQLIVASDGDSSRQACETMRELANVYYEVGDYQRSGQLLEKIGESLRPISDREPDLWSAYLETAGVRHMHAGRLMEASNDLVNCVNIRRRVLGEKDEKTNNAWSNLASLYDKTGQRELSAPIYERLVKSWDDNKDYRRQAIALDNLSQVHRANGEGRRAHELSIQAVDLFEKHLEPHDPDLLEAVARLGILQSEQGETQAAAGSMRRAMTGQFSRWSQLRGTLTARQRLELAVKLNRDIDDYLRLAIAAKVSDDEIYAYLLDWKGSVQTQLWRERAQLRFERNGDEGIAEAFEHLRDASAALAALALQSKTAAELPVHRRQVATAADNFEAAEAGLAKIAREVGKPLEATTSPLDQLRQSLDDAVLVDFMTHRRTASNANGVFEQTGVDLVAFVVRRDQPVAAIPLGNLEAVTKLITEWRKTYGRGFQQSARPEVALRRLLWDRLPEPVHSARVVLIAPVGSLALFPWGALPGPEGHRWLIERQAIGIVPVPALLGLKKRVVAPAGSRHVLVVGDINYGTVTAESSDLLWRSLPGTKTELQFLLEIFQEKPSTVRVTPMRGIDSGRKQVLEAVSNKQTIHFATHGFFELPQFKQRLNAASGESEARNLERLYPELLSGIVLSGANGSMASGTGYLTALEISGLDLADTELVTISACDTGLGVEHATDGLIGLQRAFQISGARSCVCSLWPVDDAATAQTMRVFINNWRTTPR